MGNKEARKRQKKIVHELCFVAAGFAPVCGDSPRSLRGEPGRVPQPPSGRQIQPEPAALRRFASLFKYLADSIESLSTQHILTIFSIFNRSSKV